jgi:hypothetical protein
VVAVVVVGVVVQFRRGGFNRPRDMCMSVSGEYYEKYRVTLVYYCLFISTLE